MTFVEFKPIGDTLAHHIEIHPLPEEEGAFDKIIKLLIENCKPDEQDSLWETLDALRKHNLKQLENHGDGPLGIILDGSRNTEDEEGFLGDAVESSRVVNLLRGQRTLIVLTDRPAVFSGPSAATSPFPSEKSIWRSPCCCGLPRDSDHHRAVIAAAGNAGLVASPTICRFPHWFGAAANYPSDLSKSLPPTYLQREYNHISFKQKHFWLAGKLLNQTQAHQVWLYLMGVLERPTAIQPPFLVTEVLGDLSEIFSQKIISGEELLLIHVGTSETGGKKRWSEEKWTEFLNLCFSELPQHRICFWWPSGEDDQATTQRLIEYAAEQQGFAPLESRRGMTLQWFISALRTLIDSTKCPPILVGIDSMPAGHLYPSLGGRAVVIGNRRLCDSQFSCPASNDCVIVLPPEDKETANDVSCSDVIVGIKALS